MQCNITCFLQPPDMCGIHLKLLLTKQASPREIHIRKCFFIKERKQNRAAVLRNITKQCFLQQFMNSSGRKIKRNNYLLEALINQPMRCTKFDTAVCPWRKHLRIFSFPRRNLNSDSIFGSKNYTLRIALLLVLKIKSQNGRKQRYYRLRRVRISRECFLICRILTPSSTFDTVSAGSKSFFCTGLFLNLYIYYFCTNCKV